MLAAGVSDRMGAERAPLPEEPVMADVIRRRFLLVPFALLLAGCDLSLGHLAGRASDEKIRRYPLSAGGEIAIVNTNGKIEVEGTDASEVEVKIERIAR